MKEEDISTAPPLVRAWHEKMASKSCGERSQGSETFGVLDSPAESRSSGESESESSEGSISSSHDDYDLHRTSFQSRLTDETSVDSRQEFEPAKLVPRLDIDESLNCSQADFKLEMLMQDIMSGLEDFEREDEYEDAVEGGP